AVPDKVKGIVTLDGNPLAGAFVRLTPAEDVGKGYTGKTDQNGAFEINNIAPGQYNVSFTTPDRNVSLPARYRASNMTPIRVECERGTIELVGLDSKSNEKNETKKRASGVA